MPTYFHPNINVSAFSGSYHREEEEHLGYQGTKHAVKYTVKIFLNTHFVRFFSSSAVVPSGLNEKNIGFLLSV